VEFTDTGAGVAHPEHLFRPFQEGADSSGLGLYLSRAFLRSFGGEIRYQPVPGGACFTVSLNQVDSPAPGFPMTETRIMMVDDHGLFRESLGRLLESTPEFCIVRALGNRR